LENLVDLKFSPIYFMNKVLIIARSWEGPRLYRTEDELKKGDKVVVFSDQSDSGEFGEVVEIDLQVKEEPENKILRKIIQREENLYQENKKQVKEVVNFAKESARKNELEMKIIDAAISLDGKQAILAFVSDGRIDFRNLVKEIASKFKKMIRMQQIGSRDEARITGGYGICGRELCCVKFGGNMQSITTDMARCQQIFHRGSERISGLCGRLMCCLAYESEQYKEMLRGMPELHSTTETPEGKGTIVEINAITQEVKVKLENGKYISIKKEDLK
jgi:cell fate regulator YaaT (PSP1 superfamily)